MTWVAVEDCACVVKDEDTALIRLLPFRPRRDGPLPVNFGLFDRITIPGPQVNVAGAVAMPPSWTMDAKTLARTALRHGTRLDFVLHVDDLRT